MKKRKDIINQRLARIAAAPPAQQAAAPLCARQSGPLSGPLSAPARQKRPRRGEERVKTFKPGKLVFGRGAEMRCVVSDVSGGGARIMMDRGDEPPDRVTLILDHAPLPRPARIAWRGEKEYGLCYLADEEL